MTTKTNFAESLIEHGQTDDKSLAIIKRTKDALDHEYALCARDFWYFCRFVKTEDEEQKKYRDFPVQYEYLHKLQYSIDNNQKTVVLKSRRLLVSWLMILRQLWQAIFAGTKLPQTHAAFHGGLMTIGQEEAEYLIGRVKKVNLYLPDWITCRNPLEKDNVMRLEWSKGGIIHAFPLKRQGPRTFGFSEIGFDEMAFQEAVRTVWAGMMPTLGRHGKLLGVSTPNGKNNLFADVWFNKDGNYKDINREKLHWRDNPEHDDEWYKWATAGLDAQTIAREYELSFAAYLGQPVWANEFDYQANTAEETEVIESRPMFIGWDLGYHYPAATFWQRNTRDQWVGLAEIQGYDIEFGKFCKQVKELANTFYDRRKIQEIHCVPPDAKNRYHSKAQSGAANDLGEIMNVFKMSIRPVQVRFGATEIGVRNNEGPRLKETRRTFILRSDGLAGVYFDRNKMPLFLEGCQGGYCYPDKGDTEIPDKNESSHLQDSFQMVVTGYNRMMGATKGETTTENVIPQRRNIIQTIKNYQKERKTH